LAASLNLGVLPDEKGEDMSQIIPEMNRTVGSILTRRAFLEGKKEAIIFRDIRLTYQELENRANSIANASLQLGIKHGDRVGILMYNSNEYLELVFGMAKIGAIVVLINFRLVGREIEFILKDSGVKALFYSSEFIDLINEIRPRVPDVRIYISVGGDSEETGYSEVITKGETGIPSAHVELEDNFMILYTAGTTGRPKGALITHRNCLYGIINMILSMKVSVWRPLVAGPLFHVASINGSSMPCIFYGGTQVLIDAFDPEIALQTIVKEKCSVTMGVPLFAKLMLDIQKEKNYDLSSFEAMIIGGAPVPAPLIREWMKYDVRLVDLYGMT